MTIKLKIVRKLVFFILISVVPLNGLIGQQSKTDSLIALQAKYQKKDTINANLLYDIAYALSKSDTEKSFHYSDSLENLGLYFQNNNEVDLAQKYLIKASLLKGEAFMKLGKDDQRDFQFDKAIALSRQNIDKNIEAETLYKIARWFHLIDDYKLALDYYERSFMLEEKMGNESGLARLMNNMGIVYKLQGDYSKAIDLYTQSLKLYEKIGNEKGMAGSIHSIGNIYLAQGSFNKAIEYYNNSLVIKEELDDKAGIAKSLNNMGITYFYLREIDKAKGYYHRSLQIKEELLDKKGMLNSLNNIGLIFTEEENYKQALDYFNRSLKIGEEIGAKWGIANSLNNIGIVYRFKGDFTRAVDFSHKSLQIAQEIGAITVTLDASSALYAAYKAMGNSKKALEMYELYNETNDKILSDENEREVLRQEYKYSYDKQILADSLSQVEKSLKLELVHQGELRKKEKSKNIFLASGILILILALTLWSRNRFIKKSNNLLAEAKERAEQSEQYKEQFLANMSHEIRTPMNAVVGMTNLLIDKEPREDQFAYLEGIQKSSDNLLHIINDILDISKIQAGKMELELIDFSIADTVNQVKQMLKHRAEDKGLVLVSMIKSDVNDVVLGDPVRLNQVLINLIGNAIKFTEKGSVSIEVCIEENGIRFAIVDTGIGISEDKLTTIFESFSQANLSDSRKYGGTGLGLSISRQLVELMGGTIEIESEEGLGTTFFFVVNFEKGSKKRLEQRMAMERNVDGSILNGIKILLTDDNEYNRVVARDSLKSKANIEIYEAENGQEAIDLLKENDFDLILMDVQMPIMNGLEATKHIRTNFQDAKQNIPIIALTASVMRGDLDKCIKAGMNSYIPKPFNSQELITGIANVLGIDLIVKNEKTKKITKSKSNKNAGKTTNMEYLNDFCNEDGEKIKKYIGMFTSSAPRLIDDINTAFEEKDFESIANQVHGFKTKWIMMGMKETKDLAIELELLCREDPSNKLVAKKIENLINNINQAIDELS